MSHWDKYFVVVIAATIGVKLVVNYDSVGPKLIAMLKAPYSIFYSKYRG